MPHHIEDGDNVGSQPGHVTPDSQSGSLCTGTDASSFQSADSDKEGASSDNASVRHASKKIQNLDEQMILLLTQVSWVGMLSDYNGLFNAIRIACNHNRSFPQKRDWCDTVFQVLPQKNTISWWSCGLSTANIPGGIFCYHCKRFSAGYPLGQHSISFLSAGATLVTLIREVPGQREGLNEGCISSIYWF